MIKAILRGLVGFITLPFILGAYWLVSVGLVALGAEPTGHFTDSLWSIGIVWVALLVIYPVLARQLNKVIA
jgi:hypothetical protein